MVERIGVKIRQGRHGGSADKTVEQNRNAQMPRRKRGAEHGSKLAPAECRGDAQRIAKDREVPGEPRIDHLALALEALIIEAGAMTGKARAAAANSAAEIAEAAVVLPMPISPKTTRSASGESAS